MTRIRVSPSLSSGSSMSCNTGDLLSSMFFTSPLARTFTNLACVLFILRNYAVLFSVLVFFFPPWTCFYFLCIFISRLNPCFTLFHLDTLPSGHPPIWTPSPSLCLLPEQWQAGEHEEADQVVWMGHDGHFHAARHSGAVQSCESQGAWFISCLLWGARECLNDCLKQCIACFSPWLVGLKQQ